MPPPLGTVSPRNAKTKAFGIVAPRRFNMIGCGIATTSALIARAPGGHGTICTGAAVFAVAGSVSISTGVAGGSSFVVAIGVTGIFDAESGSAALGSTAAFSTEAVGV